MLIYEENTGCPPNSDLLNCSDFYRAPLNNGICRNPPDADCDFENPDATCRSFRPDARSVLGRRLFEMFDNQHGDGRFLRLHLESELLLHS